MNECNVELYDNARSHSNLSRHPERRFAAKALCNCAGSGKMHRSFGANARLRMTIDTQLLCSRRLHFSADALHLAEYAHQIPPENLVNVFGTVAAIEQRLCDLRQVGG